MQNRRLRIVHYLNQFFGGIGGEDKAFVGPQLKVGPVGPGRVAEEALGERGNVVATVLCGDNYFGEGIEKATAEVIELIASCQPDAVIAGPAFDSGRHGIACGAVCKAVEIQLGIPAITAMHQENPGVDLFRKDVTILETEDSVRKMSEIVFKMVNLVCRLAAKEKLDKPSVEGYFPRGFLKNETSDRTGAERAISMLLAKLRGDAFESEIPKPKYDRVEPAPGIKDLRSAVIALVTDGGLVPKGNPDRIEAKLATRFASYSIKGREALVPGEYEVNHIGYSPVFVNEDPHRLVPLDVMRELEKEGVIGKLHEKFYVTTGAVGITENAKKMGEAIGRELRADGVSGVILTST
jgi:betaine reductase